jgi:hypothetical protein
MNRLNHTRPRQRFDFLPPLRHSMGYALALLPLSLWFGCQHLPSGNRSTANGSSSRQEDPRDSPSWLDTCRIGALTPSISPVQVAIQSIERPSRGTAVRIVGYTAKEEGLLHLPLYVLSRGRWLIGETQRTFLIDDLCRTYSLIDVAFPGPRIRPGEIQLKPHQAIEGTLHFPPLSSQARWGLLVFGEHRALFVVPPQSTSSNSEGGEESPLALPRR